MGIEGDQLVLDYLSRVGDLAQQRALPSGQRMRLVADLRANIDKVRAAEGAHSRSAVKQILARFGTPSAIVEAAKEDPATAVPEVAVGPSDPPPRGGLSARLPRPRVGGSEGWLGRLPRPRSGGSAGGKAPYRPQEPAEPVEPFPPSPTAAGPPHLAGEDELDPAGADPDWWRVEPSPFGGGPSGGGSPKGGSVPGFSGGIELPELFKPPERQDDGRRPEPEGAKEAPGKGKHEDKYEDEYDDAADDEDDGAYGGRGAAVRELLLSLGPLEVLAIGALVAGAVLGQWVAVLVGWLLAYGSRRLTLTEKKWAALGVPGTVALAALVWLWGRFEGRWGEPVRDGDLGTEMSEAFPVVVRAAAVASALFLLWRARRRLRA